MLIPLKNEIQNIINNNLRDANINLLFSKYVNCWWTQDWDFEKENREGTSGKSAFFTRSISSVKNQNKQYYNNFFNRHLSFLKSISALRISGKVHWRLVVGLGSGGVLETSMTLHHILGVPYIPGSALKGLVSDCYLYKYNMKIENADDKYKQIFGTEKQKGKVIFLDSYPVKFPELELDIMNPHYGDYYSAKKDSNNNPIPPADWLSPNPIKFVTVGKDTEFIFAFKTDDDTLASEVKNLIKNALENYGIGAKSSVGYGYFKDLQDYQI